MKKLSLIIIILIASFSASAQNKFYVSTTGNNSNTGLTASSPFLTIQYAINAAQNNDSIILLDGNYSEHLTITKSLVIGSQFLLNVQNPESHILATSLTATNSNTLINFTNNNNLKLELVGFTIKDCPSQVINLSSTNGSVIRNMRFVNNGNIGVSVVNIYGNTVIKNCYFDDNEFGSLIALSAGGIGFPTVTACEFRNNGLTSQFSKSLIYSYNKSVVSNNLIYNNIGTMISGGCNAPLDTFQITNNTIVANQGTGVSIGHCYGGVKAYIYNNIIENNTLGTFSFQGYAGYSIVYIKNNKITSHVTYTSPVQEFLISWQNNDSTATQVFNYPILNKSQLNLPNNSTLIGSGLNHTLPNHNKDFYNQLRPNPLGSIMDIGAVENSLSQPQILLTDSISVCANDTLINLMN